MELRSVNFEKVLFQMGINLLKRRKEFGKNAHKKIGTANAKACFMFLFVEMSFGPGSLGQEDVVGDAVVGQRSLT